MSSGTPRVRAVGNGFLTCAHVRTLGVVLHENIPPGETITAALYSDILDRVAEAMRVNRPHRRPKEVLFLHDNARPHTAKRTKRKLLELGWELLPHPPYSPDMAPSDFHLFRSLKNHIRGVEFRTADEIMDWLEEFYRSKPASFFVKGIMKLKTQWEGVIEFDGDYAIE